MEASQAAGKAVFLIGDLNISPFPLDSCDPGDSAAFVERRDRQWFHQLLSIHGFVDMFRHFHPTRCACMGSPVYPCQVPQAILPVLWLTYIGTRICKFATYVAEPCGWAHVTLCQPLQLPFNKQSALPTRAASSVPLSKLPYLGAEDLAGCGPALMQRLQGRAPSLESCLVP